MSRVSRFVLGFQSRPEALVDVEQLPPLIQHGYTVKIRSRIKRADILQRMGARRERKTDGAGWSWRTEKGGSHLPCYLVIGKPRLERSDHFRLFYLCELFPQCTCTLENLALPPYKAEAERRNQMSTTWVHDNCACSRPLRPRPERIRAMPSAPIQADETV